MIKALLNSAILFAFANQLFAEKNHELKNFELNGITRNYHLHLPEDLKKEAPLVVVLHGFGSSGEKIMNYSKMNKIADTKKFAVCYPYAAKNKKGKRSWNVGYSNHNVNDVLFLSNLIKYIQKKHGLSTTNTFCTGMSNGADITLLMACKTKLFAGIAPVCGCLMNWVTKESGESPPIPIMMTNGTNDKITLWAGDKNYKAKPVNGYLSTPNMVDFWIRKNKVNKKFQKILPDKNQKDKSTVLLEKWNNEAKNLPVWLYTLKKGGHDWPGAFGNKDVLISEEIWKFFEDLKMD